MNCQILPGRIILTIEDRDHLNTVEELMDRFCQSRKNRYLLIRDRQMQIGSRPVTSLQAPLHSGDKLLIRQMDEPLGFEPSATACPVVYEDELIYAAHKNDGLIVHSSDGGDCLAAQAARWQLEHGIDSPVRYIHRLDRDTIGLVLFVKVPFFQPWYDAELSAKRIRRSYLAIVKGPIETGTTLTFNDPIGRDRHVSGKYRVSRTGAAASTHITCLAADGPYRLLRCELGTGRTHQIRVHCAAHGLPIVNDRLYGNADRAFRHMGLWADQLEVTDPLTGARIDIRDTPNPEFARFSHLMPIKDQ